METQSWSPPRGAGRRNGEGERELRPPCTLQHSPFLSVRVTVGTGCRHSTHDATYDAGNAMQVVDTTCVLDP